MPLRRYVSAPTDDPWWAGIEDSAHPHYARALQLDRFARNLARGPSLMMSARKLAYRQRCIDHWRYYLDNGVPPDKG